MTNEWMAWCGFILFVLAMLAFDLGVFQRKGRVISVRESLLWTGFWIVLALLFNLGIYWWKGSQIAAEFLTAYLLEKSLSMDNIFVFLLIFSYFGVSPGHQHKVLFWGILGALILRGVFIVAGVALIRQFEWILYFFGAFLIYTAFKMMRKKDKEIHPEKNPVLKLFQKFFPLTESYEGDRFFVKRGAQYFATPLMVVLLVIETTDVVFAVDSIPAVFGVTLDPFIVYTSNIFAILGLRALYFALAGIIAKFRYLHYGLAALLAFIGLKMLISDFVHIPTGVALGVVACLLLVSIAISLLVPANRVKQ
ncbi:MAG: TerC family protein [Candidatus Omnitrophica bacterium]|nr:TerC family protein [Candidatus Omnitrophota bacterium]